MAKRSKTSPASQDTAMEAPRSDTSGDAPDNQPLSDLNGVSANTSTQKPTRGRPPKPKSTSQQNDAVTTQPSRKPSGRPKKNRSLVTVTTASVAVDVKSGRGRPKRSNPLPETEPLAITVDGSRKRGRPNKDAVTASTFPASTMSPVKKLGRKPRGEEVDKKTVGMPGEANKESSVATEAADLKKKSALLQKKVEEAANKLKIAVSAIEEVQALVAGM